MKNEKDILIQGMSKTIDIPIEVLNMMIEENKCAKEFKTGKSSIFNWRY